ncbi:hypothetical protein PTNB73_03252 [Pyrenophora teres f. teres]|uniref:Uncharacterized protein n=1 Tax=Pyrenophora teres f. teres TaxID=97479 RepID=A0A6S6W3K4_9PLEO|nr:hypothetical protein HRS9139_03111 [Pyrenophora teres f. teres]KAE8844694.1 hypothetical protein PTNB85_02959 [Pyrenophora teres f. teres]KAE8847105.1 hypothetical protein HRS9122_04012 [Pyrenophora teres f. teres]KAE8866158.1 hypothetical protein PTNB29_03305 [Pyrenophora teres f. teres]KAE8871793.1 hypothetical protein PTNB73_03252 [Pyrenophora teres f. teres]
MQTNNQEINLAYSDPQPRDGGAPNPGAMFRLSAMAGDEAQPPHISVALHSTDRSGFVPSSTRISVQDTTTTNDARYVFSFGTVPSSPCTITTTVLLSGNFSTYYEAALLLPSVSDRILSEFGISLSADEMTVFMY